MNNINNLIRSLDVHVLRDEDLELHWNYADYEDKIEEALSYHCPNVSCSGWFKSQLSQLHHQGYIVIENLPLAVPISSIYHSLERIGEGGNRRGSLDKVSIRLGFPVSKVHFGQSSFITENWENYAKHTGLANQELNSEVLYESLIGSLSKQFKTGEWIVFSQDVSGIHIWCIWLHDAGDNALVNEIQQRK